MAARGTPSPLMLLCLQVTQCETRSHLARRRSLFLVLGASTSVCVWQRSEGGGGAGVWFVRRKQQHEQQHKVACLAQAAAKLKCAQPPLPPLPHTHTLTCVLVRLWMVVMQPCLMPSCSWMTLTTGARQLVVQLAAVTMWSTSGL